MASQVPLGNIEDLLEVVRFERNAMTASELRLLRRQQPGTFQDKEMILRIGTRVFKNASLFDTRKIKKAYQNYSYIDSTSNAVVDATIVAYNSIKILAQRHRVTGAYFQSFSIFVRNVGGIDRETTLLKIQRGDLPARPVITILSDVPYAAKLESLSHHGRRLGFLYYVSKEIKKEFGKAIETKFDYLAGSRLGRVKAKYLPRLQISNPGDLRGRSKKPRLSSRR